MIVGFMTVGCCRCKEVTSFIPVYLDRNGIGGLQEGWNFDPNLGMLCPWCVRITTVPEPSDLVELV